MTERAADIYKIQPNYTRFDQKYEMFKRPWWDPTLAERINNLPVRRIRDEEEELLGRALAWGGIYLDYSDGSYYGGHRTELQGLYGWEEPVGQLGPTEKSEKKLCIQSPEEMARVIKRKAQFYGASIAGICKVDERWVYATRYESCFKPPWREPIHEKQDIPDWWRYVIVMGVEMNYDSIMTSPSYEASAQASLAYSKMGFIAGSLAAYIRGLGYHALPSGNDTILSIPSAVDAGLGQLGRNGLLITREYGPRIRLCKVITDLPLKLDKPIDLGVDDFCRKCKKCAKHCPSQAITYGEKTFEGPTISNNPGVLKWFINPEKCKLFWVTNSGQKAKAPHFIRLLSCCTCIRVCPWNKKLGWHHNLAKRIITNFPVMNGFLIGLDDALGYGKHRIQGKY